MIEQGLEHVVKVVELVGVLILIATLVALRSAIGYFLGKELQEANA